MRLLRHYTFGFGYAVIGNKLISQPLWPAIFNAQPLSRFCWERRQFGIPANGAHNAINITRKRALAHFLGKAHGFVAGGAVRNIHVFRLANAKAQYVSYGLIRFSFSMGSNYSVYHHKMIQRTVHRGGNPFRIPLAQPLLRPLKAQIGIRAVIDYV